MTVGRDEIYDLLPALYRLRDQERATEPGLGGPLRQFLEVLTDQVAAIDENLKQLQDDMFVETAAPWVLPYIGELIGLRGLPASAGRGMTPRAEVANTIGYRRRKGTAAVLEQIARDVTGWPARAVEFFELLVTTQHMNHVRRHNLSVVNIRPAKRLAWVGTPFERHPPSSTTRVRHPRPGVWVGPAFGREASQADLPHVVDVRRIESRRGRYNIPNVGIFLWRLRAYGLTRSPAVPAEPGEEHRFFFHPLGLDSPLFTLPATEDEISQLAQPINVPLPISRQLLHEEVTREEEEEEKRRVYYGKSLSLFIETFLAGEVAVEGVPADKIDVCDLSNHGGGWAHTPPDAGCVAVDPVLGRLAFADAQAKPPLVSFHSGFSADMGGGEYSRVRTLGETGRVLVAVSNQPDPDDLDPPPSTIAAGLTALGVALDDPAADSEDKRGTVEIRDSGRYVETPSITANGRRIELRAADGHRPTLLLDGDFIIKGDIDGTVVLNGLLIDGGSLRVSGLGRLVLRHCTLVPGNRLVIESPETAVEVDACILGPVRADLDASVRFRDCIIDAGEAGVAYAALPEGGSAAADGPGGKLVLERCTVLGKVHTRVLELASNSLFLSRVAEGEEARWPGPVIADRRQEGCVRYSYLPAGSRTPRRFNCQPARDAEAASFRPVLTSRRYGDPGYCQLDRRTAEEIRRGADDESEMGAFHSLFQAHREAYLQLRLDEYLRFGLEAGIYFAS